MELTDKDVFLVKAFLATLEVASESSLEELNNEKLMTKKVVKKLCDDGVFGDKREALEFVEENYDKIKRENLENN